MIFVSCLFPAMTKCKDMLGVLKKPKPFEFSQRSVRAQLQWICILVTIRSEDVVFCLKCNIKCTYAKIAVIEYTHSVQSRHQWPPGNTLEQMSTMSQTIIQKSNIKPFQSRTTPQTSKHTSNTTTQDVLVGDVHMLLIICGCPKRHV